MVAHTDVDVEQPGEPTIPARKLADIWRALPDGSDVAVSVEEIELQFEAEKPLYSATLPATDFPKIEGGETDVVVSVAQADLRALIDEVGFAMAQQVFVIS